MSQGIKTIIYPVKDVERAKSFYTKLLGVTPYVDSAYYVGFKVGDQDIGLDPNYHKSGPVGYYHVSDINESLQLLIDAGGQIEQKAKDVGGGRLVASVRDSEGSLIGLVQDTVSTQQ
jgi:predicted enzyme related to lactoylglutathione lyase